MEFVSFEGWEKEDEVVPGGGYAGVLCRHDDPARGPPMGKRGEGSVHSLNDRSVTDEFVLPSPLSSPSCGG